MQQHLPKQYLPLGEHLVLSHTINAFLASDRIHAICVVIHSDDCQLYETAVTQIDDRRLREPVFGGRSRAESVHLGLQALADFAPACVLIHDGARPFCSTSLIEAVLAPLGEVDGAFAALPVVDALWRADGLDAVSPVSRNGLWRAQTPQAFNYVSILAAHAAVDGDALDDVEIARSAGLKVRVVEGDENNFKITLPRDLDRAAKLLKTASQSSEC
jgi:2-C-methyl-D-erythritol 4-phosphate cytidylyltransferase